MTNNASDNPGAWYAFLNSLQTLWHKIFYGHAPGQERFGYELWIVDHVERTSKTYAFETLQEAMDFAYPEYLYNQQQEYVLMHYYKTNTSCVRLNKLPVIVSPYKKFTSC